MLNEIYILGIEGAEIKPILRQSPSDCSLGGLAQLRFHFAEALFDRIEVRNTAADIAGARPTTSIAWR